MGHSERVSPMGVNLVCAKCCVGAGDQLLIAGNSCDESILRRPGFLPLTALAEITQQVAAKGLVVAYERGTKESKERLVSSLLGAIGVARAPAAPALIVGSRDDVIFPPGSLGELPKDVGALSVRPISSYTYAVKQALR